MSKADVWAQWVDIHNLDDSVPLFETDADGVIQTEQFGNGPHERDVLKRSAAMERLVIEQAENVETDFHERGQRYEGVIYVMYWLGSNKDVIPLYIGKSGKFASSGYKLNPNLKYIRERKSRFARWGYGTAFHLGGLSQAYFDSAWESTGETPGSSKGRWIRTLFEPKSRRLKRNVYLWMKAWEVDDIGPYTPDTGASPYLEELEQQLIALAWELYPDLLLNTEGVPYNPEAYAHLGGWTDQSDLTDFE
ncbi:hypothetical protein KTS45_11125 [Halomicroarcula limicola]|uniref:Uncharacterized protein n=1 Tax=Haloarcula limicola TaxID=1429915 RepID=A0A8J7Y9X1_9EURY|nr:hypothetical protein [Halomicroarcula limicola]MBV0924751.1 hypothetical protein [Halomicroarcula limicola]